MVCVSGVVDEGPRFAYCTRGRQALGDLLDRRCRGFFKQSGRSEPLRDYLGNNAGVYVGESGEYVGEVGVYVGEVGVYVGESGEYVGELGADTGDGGAGAGLYMSLKGTSASCKGCWYTRRCNPKYHHMAPGSAPFVHLPDRLQSMGVPCASSGWTSSTMFTTLPMEVQPGPWVRVDSHASAVAFPSTPIATARLAPAVSRR